MGIRAGRTNILLLTGQFGLPSCRGFPHKPQLLFTKISPAEIHLQCTGITILIRHTYQDSRFQKGITVRNTVVHSPFSPRCYSRDPVGLTISEKEYLSIFLKDGVDNDLPEFNPSFQPQQSTFLEAHHVPFERPIPSSIFGVPLEDIMGYEGEKGGVARIVRDAVAYIRETGMEEEGIFRRSPSSALLRAAREAYDRGNVVSLDTFGDPHLAAVLLKKYLRDLPQPIFPEALYPTIRRCPPPSNSVDMAAVTYIRDVLLPELPPCVYILLSCVLQLLHETSLHSGKNRMDAYNLAIVISPNLVKGSNPARDVMMCMAQGSPALFDGHSSPTAGGNFNAPLHTPRPQVPMTALLTPSSSSTSNANIVDPQTPVVSVTTSTPNTSPPPTPVAANNTTLGTIIKLCIQRFYEVFDEFVGDPAGKSTVGRGFGFGMDIELSGSESEGSNEGRDNLMGFRF
ncbi:RhoGAP-domain-containing protein [Marasmius fiardii PR-910]|nr:RhoGAP-domain-containing protein [Marasmius fiardii PR-910]